MKSKGHTFQYQELFTEDLQSVYRRIRREHLNRYGRINRLLLYHTVVNSPAKRFYTSEEQACRVIRGMLQGKTFPRMISLKREMYLEILSRVQSRLKKDRNQSISKIVEEVLSEPAPKFYMTPQSCEIKLNKLKVRHRKYTIHEDK